MERAARLAFLPLSIVVLEEKRKASSMTLDFDKLVGGGAQRQTEPRKLFTTLNRSPKFRRPSDEQAEVLDG